MSQKPLAPTARRHRGDIMSPEKRSLLMARIKGRDTGPEKALATVLSMRGLKWDSHAKDLPGRPDMAFRTAKVAVFVEGRFWHGWFFDRWRDKLSPRWENKIQENRDRDRRNHQRLRRLGWSVVRIWEHQVERDVEACARRVVDALGSPPRPMRRQ